MDIYDRLKVKQEGPQHKPYTMSPEEKAQFQADYAKELNDSLTPFERVATAWGRGVATVGRGLGIGEKEHPLTTQAATDLTGRYTDAMLSEIGGEASLFLPLAPASGTGLAASAGGKMLIPAAQSLLTKTALGGLIAGIEGNVISRGQGRDAATQARDTGLAAGLGMAMEILSPVLGRLGRKVFSKLGRKPQGPLIAGGEPTEELLTALKEAGSSWDDLTDEAVDFVVKNQDQLIDPAEIARRSRFQKAGIPFTKGDISQDFTQQALEHRAISSVEDLSGDALRELKLKQSDAFVGKVDDLVNKLGVPDEAGNSIKAALTARKTALRSQKNKLYQEAAESAPEVLDVPIFTDSLSDAVPDSATMRRLGRLEGSQVKALRELLVEFGVDRSEDAVEAFDGEIIPLTVRNLDEFRSSLNAIMRADNTGAATVAAKPILDALDGEADELAKSLQKAGVGGADVFEKLGQARALVRESKQTFSPQSIAGRLIDVKKDGVTPVVEASQVVRELTNKPTEQLQRTLQALSKGGTEGRKAIGDLRGAVVLDALEQTLKAPSRKINGIEVAGSAQFDKYLKKFGDDKLALLFRGDDAGLKALKDLRRIGLDMQPANAAVPKGSAPVNLDITLRLLSRLKGIPVINDVIGLARLAHNQGSTAADVAKAVRANPKMIRVAGEIEQAFPSLASALGVAGIVANTGEMEEEQ